MSLFLLVIMITGVITWAVLQFNRSQSKLPVRLGYSFSDEYARQLGLDPIPVLETLLSEIHPHQIRLMSYWDEIEPNRGEYDFTMLDSEIALAKQHGVSVSLAIGLRQPRYPECHAPRWEKDLAGDLQHQTLLAYEAAVIKRYGSQVDSWQLENEASNRTFGICPKPDNKLLLSEYIQLKKLDSHPVIMNVSDEVGLPVGQPRGNEVGISLYRRYYENQWLKRYVSYPLPSWFYRIRAALIQVYSGRPVIIHELQAEPWGPTQVQWLSLAEQDKTMDATKLKAIIRFAKQTGIKQIDLWGAEWWYWRKIKAGDVSVWDAAKDIYSLNQK